MSATSHSPWILENLHELVETKVTLKVEKKQSQLHQNACPSWECASWRTPHASPAAEPPPIRSRKRASRPDCELKPIWCGASMIRCCFSSIGRTAFGSRMLCVNDWGSSSSSLNRARPNSSNLIAMPKSTRANGGRKRPGTIHSLSFNPYCTQSEEGNFKVGYLAVREQMIRLDRFLRGHYAHYGIGGNIRTLQNVLRTVERYWRKMLSSRSRKGKASCGAFQRLKARCPL